jgi:nitrogen fixation NifU-like protein
MRRTVSLFKYSAEVIKRFNNPSNVGTLDRNNPNVSIATVGAPACGDVLQLSIEVKDNIITDAKFKGFGCGSLLASGSRLTENLKGMSVDEAQKISNRDIANFLSLPPVKIHCSLLAEEAIKKVLNLRYIS